MKVLVTGSNGQLGSEIIHIQKSGTSDLGKIDNIYSTAQIVEANKDMLDITVLNDVRKVLNTLKPDVVINTAAYTNVDKCETEMDLAFKVNALGAKNLAMICEDIGAKLIHISSDYVFAGDNQKPYREYDMASPINVYGKTKYLGEQYVRGFCSKYFILRTSWLYGFSGRNFVKTIIKVASEKKHLDVVDDQIGTPTNAQDLAYHIFKIALTTDYGIYHCTGNSQCSWFEFAKRIIEYGKIDCTISPIKSEKLNQIAKRPSYSVLDNLMLRCTIKDKMRNWEDALQVFINEVI